PEIELTQRLSLRGNLESNSLIPPALHQGYFYNNQRVTPCSLDAAIAKSRFFICCACNSHLIQPELCFHYYLKTEKKTRN
ncbi:hypothetical protein, partial [Legionella worsleiensis]|uniref:hypothetical protein n=1 Tax=Legionella worsleiensis TaxID=45076 RepID=UPI0039E9ED89